MAEKPTKADMNAAVLSAESYVRKCRSAVEATKKTAREARTNYEVAKARAKAAPKVKRWKEGAQVNYDRFQEASEAALAAAEALVGAVESYEKVVAARAKAFRTPPRKKTAKKKAATKKKAAKKTRRKVVHEAPPAPNPEPAPAPNTTEGNGAATS